MSAVVFVDSTCPGCAVQLVKTLNEKLNPRGIVVEEVSSPHEAFWCMVILLPASPTGAVALRRMRSWWRHVRPALSILKCNILKLLTGALTACRTYLVLPRPSCARWCSPSW
jgi:hypothetical protein